MKIGIDLDGVVIDSEKLLRVYEEIYDVNTIRGNNLIYTDEVRFQNRYSWNEEQKNEFIEKYLLKASDESNVMPGFKQVYKLLKDEGHEFIVITARGKTVKAMKGAAENFLKKHNITFDKYYWETYDKLEVCKKEKVDIMIDDNYSMIENIAGEKIKTLYFRDAGLKKLPENEYIKEVNNWGDVYRYIKEY